MSIYLFVPASKALSHSLYAAKEDGMIQGIKLTIQSPVITHLLFANDSIFFSKATKDEAYHLISILNSYIVASGQMINIEK